MVHHPLWIKVLLLGCFFCQASSHLSAMALPLWAGGAWSPCPCSSPSSHCYLQVAVACRPGSLPWARYLGPQGPLVLPLLDPPVRLQEKSGSLTYRHTCLMNHQRTHQTINQIVSWVLPDTPLDPLGPQAPIDPLWTPKHPPWPQWTPRITWTAFKWSEDP